MMEEKDIEDNLRDAELIRIEQYDLEQDLGLKYHLIKMITRYDNNKNKKQ